MKPRLTLSRKVFLLLLFPLLFLLAFVQLSTQLRHDVESNAAAISRSREVIEQTSGVLRLLENATGAMNGYALTHDARFASESVRIQRQVDPALSRLFSLLKDSPNGAEAGAQLAANAQRLEAALKRIRLATESPSASNQDASTAIAAAKQALDDFSRSGDQLISQEEKLDAQRAAALQHHWNRVDDSIFWGAVAAAFLTVVLGWQLGRSITGRLAVLARNAERFAERKALHPPVGGEDEIGSLDGAFHQMADALSRANRREQALMTNVADVICSFDLDGRFTAVSPASARVFGYEPADLIGRSWIDLMVPHEEIQATRAAVRLVPEKAETSTIEARVRRLDGRTLTVVWTVTWSKQEALCFAVARDVTARLAAEAERQFYLETIDRLEEAVFELDRACIIRQMSHAWSALSGERRSDAIGRPLTGFAHAADRDQLQSTLNVVLSGAENVARMRFRLPRLQGESWVDAHLLPHRDAYGTITGVRGVLRDVTQSYLQEQKIAKLALHDPLTGLPNRTLLDDRLGVSLAMAKRSGLRVAAAFVDVDNFKQVNDRLGHDAGDRVLKRLADAMSGELRKGDTLARWGGDEFVALLPDLGSEEEAVAIAQRLLKAANAAKEDLPVTLSIGLAMYPDHAREAADLLKAADRAMFRAKGAGRNNLQLQTIPVSSPGSIH